MSVYGAYFIIRFLQCRQSYNYIRFGRSYCYFRLLVVVRIIWRHFLWTRHDRKSQICRWNFDAIYRSSRDISTSGLGGHVAIRLRLRYWQWHDATSNSRAKHIIMYLASVINLLIAFKRHRSSGMQVISASGFRRHITFVVHYQKNLQPHTMRTSLAFYNVTLCRVPWNLRRNFVIIKTMKVAAILVLGLLLPVGVWKFMSAPRLKRACGAEHFGLLQSWYRWCR